ncbi:unnamed protein product [Cunninghamella blakesleeana]
MPICHFEIFTGERRLIETVAVSQLKGLRLGINGSYWLRKIMLKEPALAAIGGAPIALQQCIEKELEAFKNNNIQPVFVFPGLNIVRKSKPFSTEDTRPGNRASAWELYEKGRVETAMNNFSYGGGFHLPDVLNFVFSILHKHHIEFIRAPYLPWAQLAYMYNHPRHIINAVYSSTELLMWNIDKIITTIDFTKGNYQSINKRTVLNDLHVSDDQFLDICLLAGFDYCPSFQTSTMMSFAFKDVQDLIKQYKTGFNAVQSHADDENVVKTGYIDTYCRIRCAIKYHLVMTDEGEVKPLHIEQAPNDIHEFIGYRLPDELYYYLMSGLIGPQVINNLISGVLIENAPLDGGDTTEYRNFLHQLLSIRTQTLSLLTQPLHQFFQNRKVACYFWFDPSTEYVMYHHPSQGSNESQQTPNFLNSVYEKTSTWNVDIEKINTEMKEQHTDHVDLNFCLKATLNETKAAKTLSQPQSEHSLDEKNEIIANVLWKLLEIRDFLTSSKHVYTTWGSAISKSLSTFTNPSQSIQEAYLTAYELIRFGVLHAKPYSKTYSKPVTEDIKHQQHITLFTRALSLLPMEFKNTPWSGPIHRDILVFNGFVRALTRSYRNLSEMLTLSFFLNDLVKKERDDYHDIVVSLPYLNDNNVALGIVANHYLKQVLDNNNDNEKAYLSTESHFPTCSNIKTDLQKGFEFWNGLMEGVKVLKDAKKLDDETYAMFTDANEWLQPKMKF